MKNIDSLIAKWQKETKIAEEHQKIADDLKKQIDSIRAEEFNSTISKLNLDSSEMDAFLKLMRSGKQNVMKAVELANTTKGDKANNGISISMEENVL